MENVAIEGMEHLGKATEGKAAMGSGERAGKQTSFK